MSVEQARRNLNQIDKELADLEKKMADAAKKEADKTKRVNDVQKSITKNTSSSTLQSKMRQIQGYQNELVRISNTKADINKKIADRRKWRSGAMQKLQREELEEAKKIEKSQNAIYSNYEKRIAEISTQQVQTIAVQSKPQHLYSERVDEEYDVFISHASEDKEGFADELCEELKASGIRVWYDALTMTWGDSLRSKIDNGLHKSKYGIVVISKDYIKKGWTNYELDGLFQREMTDGKTILPIWHNITKKEVEAFSLTLAGRLALSSATKTPSEIAGELNKILGVNSLAETEEQSNDQ